MGKNVEFLKVKAGGTYSNRCALRLRDSVFPQHRFQRILWALRNCFVISKAMKRCQSFFVFGATWDMQFVSCRKLTYQQLFWISARIKCQILDINQMSHLQQQNSNHLYVLGVSWRTDGIQTSPDIQERKQENRMEHETTGIPELIERHDLTENNTFSRQMCRNRTVH
jgi:hypothetical protein